MTSTAYIQLFFFLLTICHSVAVPRSIVSSSVPNLRAIHKLQNAMRLYTPQGYTGDGCKENSDCQGNRKCINRFKGTPCCTRNCACLPRRVLVCDVSSECPTGETCVKTWDAPYICFSEAKVNFYNTVHPGIYRSPEDIPAPQTPVLIPTCPAPSPSAVKKGLYNDLCNPGTCQDGLSCVRFQKLGEVSDRPDFLPICCQPGEQSCFCARKQIATCSGNSDCLIGEACAEGPGSAPLCYSKQFLEHKMATVKGIIILDDVVHVSPKPELDSGCTVRAKAQQGKSSFPPGFEELLSDLQRVLLSPLEMV